PDTNTWNEVRTDYTIPGGATDVNLSVIEDATVSELTPDTNYDTPGPLEVGAHRRVYIKYNLTNISSSAKITDMTQYIYWQGYCTLCGLEGNPTYTRKTTSDWDSNTITWNNQPTVETSSTSINFHMWFNEQSIGDASSSLQDSIDNGDPWYGVQITSFNEQSHTTNSDYGQFNSIEECSGCPPLYHDLLPGSQIVIDWVPKIPLMAASFVIGDRGYTLSADGNLQSYDQFSDLWRDHSSIPSYGVYPNRPYANVTWAINFNGKGYVLVGDTMWEYTPSGDDWTEMSSTSHFNSLQYPAGFIIEDTIFVGTGLLDGTKTASMFSFHPATDTWTLESTSFPSARSRAIVFSVDNDEGYTNIYMGGGIGSVLEDFYEMSFAYTTPRSTPIAAVIPTYLPTPDATPELPITEKEELTIFEEVLLFISTAFSWLFILAAYVGAFASSSILIREIEDFEEIKYDILLFGTLGWVVPLFINFTGLITLVTESFWLNAILFAAFGFVIYAIGDAFSKD
ncbi:MAG: DNRLRE domain-containing protein, partial [Candidatus Omnitrophica bacterium]|nr:DNRLRE domain-containing protein [Candidatus Omnitrophota bacterium]